MKAEKQKTILLVEDEAIIALDESIRINRFGYIVVVAKDGETAIRKVKENSSISLILMDINLGRGMTGPEAARIILQSKTLPIIFLSSRSEEEYSKQTEGIMNCGYLLKDSNDQKLSNIIRHGLGNITPDKSL